MGFKKSNKLTKIGVFESYATEHKQQAIPMLLKTIGKKCYI